MKQRKYLIRLLCILMCALMSQSAFAQMDVEHSVLYFYESYCESCRPESEFAVQFQSLTGISLETCAFSAYNIARQAGREALEATIADYGIAQPLLPMVIVDGVVYAGSQMLNQELPKVALSWKETTDSVVLYLYAPYCENCARAASILAELPVSVTIRRGELEFESAVRIARVDVGQDPAYAEAIFDVYNVPEEERIVPCAFISDRYFSGIETIARDLPTMVRIGRASGGTLQIENMP